MAGPRVVFWWTGPSDLGRPKPSRKGIGVNTPTPSVGEAAEGGRARARPSASVGSGERVGSGGATWEMGAGGRRSHTRMTSGVCYKWDRLAIVF